MYEKDNFGRIWFDDDSFIAPFGHFTKDYDYIINYLRDPFISERTYFDGFDENVLLNNYAQYLKLGGSGWIGFHKKKRAAYIILEIVSHKPLIYSVHGGLSKELFGKKYGAKSMEFIKDFVFNEKSATKLEGYLLHPNNFIKGYFKRGGLAKECELKNRILLDGKLSPINIYGLTREDYLKDKEKDYGWKSPEASKRPKSSRNSSSPSKGAGRRKKKVGSRKKRQRK
jgi:hypothetical protein